MSPPVASRTLAQTAEERIVGKLEIAQFWQSLYGREVTMSMW